MKKKKLLNLAIATMALAATATITSCDNGGDVPTESIGRCVITFNSVGGSSVSSVEVEGNGCLVSLPTPTKAGYEFKGWYLEASYQTLITTSYKFTSDATLYAKWVDKEVASYVVTFNTMGGSEVASIEVMGNATVTEPAQPTKEGYTFNGWYTDENGTVPFLFTTGITQDTTLYAKWEVYVPVVHEYSVTFNSMGGSSIENVKVVEGNILTKPADPTRLDYTFEGWYTDEACQTKYDFQTQVTQALTLYANWTKNPSRYELAKAKEEHLINDDFTSYTADSTLDVYSTESGVGLYQSITKSQTDYTQNKVTFDGTKATLVDSSSYGTQLVANLGDVAYNGVVEMCFDVSLISCGTSWTFIQIYGTNSTGSNKEVFGLRWESSGLAYRFNSGSTQALSSSVAEANDTPYKIYLKFDLQKQTVTVNVNDKDVLVDVAIELDALSSLRFVSSDNGSKSMSVNEVVVNHEAATLVDYQTLVNAKLEAYYNSLDKALYTKNAGELDTALANAKQATLSATTLDACKTAYDTEFAKLKAVKSDSEIALQEKRDAAINNLVATYPAANYTYNKETYEQELEKAKALINAATEAQIEAKAQEAVELMENVVTDVAYLANLRETSITDLTGYKNKDNYTINSEEYDRIISNFKTDVANAETKEEINSLLASAKSSLDELTDDATTIKNAQNAAVTKLTTYKDNQLAEVTDEETKTSVNSIFTNAVTSINAATTIENIENLESEAENDIYGIISASGMSLEDAMVQYSSDLENYANSIVKELDEEKDVELISSINAEVEKGKLAINSSSTAVAAAEALNTSEANIDALVEAANLEQGKVEAKADLYSYYDTLALELSSQAAITTLGAERDAQVGNIDAVEDVSLLTQVLTNAKEALDAKYDECVLVDKENRLDYTTQALVDKTSTVVFDWAELGASKSGVQIKNAVTYGPFVFTPNADTSKYKSTLKDGYLSTKGGTITFVTTAPNAKLTIAYNSVSGGRIFTLDSVSYEPYSDFTDSVNYSYQNSTKTAKSKTFTIVTPGTHTLEFDTNEHKIGEMILTDKVSTEMVGKVNALNCDVVVTTTAGTNPNTLVSNVSLDVDCEGEIYNEPISGYNVLVKLNGTEVDGFNVAGEYTVTVYYGTEVTKYNSKTVKVTVTGDVATHVTDETTLKAA